MGRRMSIVAFLMNLIYSLVTINVCVVRHRSFVKPVHIRMLGCLTFMTDLLEAGGDAFGFVNQYFHLPLLDVCRLVRLNAFKWNILLWNVLTWEVGGGHMPVVKRWDVNCDIVDKYFINKIFWKHTQNNHNIICVSKQREESDWRLTGGVKSKRLFRHHEGHGGPLAKAIMIKCLNHGK